MYYLYSNKGFYSGWNNDRPRWMQGFKFAESFRSISEAKNIGILEKHKGRISYFEILCKAEDVREEFSEKKNSELGIRENVSEDNSLL